MITTGASPDEALGKNEDVSSSVSLSGKVLDGSSRTVSSVIKTACEQARKNQGIQQTGEK